MVLKILKEYASGPAEGLRVEDVRIGLSYTAVRLSNGSVGVAMTFHNDMPHGCLITDRPMAGMMAAELILKADSRDLLERTVAVATINAVLNTHGPETVSGDVLDILDPGEDDVVGMVGYFGPLVNKLKQRVRELYIFEKELEKAKEVLPEEKALEILPDCSLAIITSTSLLNRSFVNIANAARSCSKTVMAGGSTPLAPDVFKPFGITLLSGIIVRDTDSLLRVVSESGGMRSFGRYTDKVNMFCE